MSSKTKNILVIDSDKHDWVQAFANVKTKSGYSIEVDQAEWHQIQVTSFEDYVVVSIKPNAQPKPNTRQNQYRQFKPDLVLIRKLVVGLNKYQQDYRNALYGFMHCNIPSVNSCFSILMNQHRPVVYGYLKQIQKKLGKDKFPLISQYYYSEPRSMLFTPEYPIWYDIIFI